MVYCTNKVRISVITDRLFRAEYLDDASLGFEDRATLGIINRVVQPIPTIQVANGTNWCNISVASSGLTISFSKRANVTNGRSSPFESHSLRATAPVPQPQRSKLVDSAIVWQAGKVPVGNLGGTFSTLSSVDGPLPLNCTGPTAPGSISNKKSPFFCTLGIGSFAVVK